MIVLIESYMTMLLLRHKRKMILDIMIGLLGKVTGTKLKCRHGEKSQINLFFMKTCFFFNFFCLCLTLMVTALINRNLTCELCCSKPTHQLIEYIHAHIKELLFIYSCMWRKHSVWETCKALQCCHSVLINYG